MRVKIWSKDGLQIIERRYDFNQTDGFNHLVAVDEVLETIPNAPIPAIQFNPSRAPRLSSALPTHLRTPDDFDY